MFWKKKTPDEEVAKNLRQAVDRLNQAFHDCEARGLSAGVRDKISNPVFLPIKIQYISRHNWEKF